jgi:hypothetical protein
MPYAVLDEGVICWRCHRQPHPAAASALDGYRGPVPRAFDLRRPPGWTRADGCDGCGTDSSRYLYGRCASCATAAVFDHLTPDPDARQTLTPLRTALLANPKAWTSVDWLRKNPQLLIGMGTGTIAIDHTALDALPRSRTTEFIRGQLLATGCLPERNNYAADFENWLPGFTCNIQPPANRILLSEYGTWRLLPRIRKPRDRRPQTYSTFQYAKTRIRAAARFLAWLDQQHTQLDNATQGHVDDFLTANTQLLPALEPFFRWTSTTHRSRRLTCRRIRRDQPKPTMAAEDRWQLLRRLLHDDELDLADRVIGALILTYGQPLTAVLRLTTDDVNLIEEQTQHRVQLKLHTNPIELAPPLDRLIIEQLAASQQPRANASITAPSRWLFPGARAGQPLSHTRAVNRLRSLGLFPGPGRSRALLHLAARVEAPLLAQALGLHPTTAVRWAELAARPYSGYVTTLTKERSE